MQTKQLTTLEDAIIDYLNTGHKELHQILQFCCNLDYHVGSGIRSQDTLRKLLQKMEDDSLIYSFKPNVKVTKFYFRTKAEMEDYSSKKFLISELILNILEKSDKPLNHFEIYDALLLRSDELHYKIRNLQSVKNQLCNLSENSDKIRTVYIKGSKLLFYSLIE
jgi:hypothetical protein